MSSKGKKPQNMMDVDLSLKIDHHKNNKDREATPPKVVASVKEDLKNKKEEEIKALNINKEDVFKAAAGEIEDELPLQDNTKARECVTNGYGEHERGKQSAEESGGTNFQSSKKTTIIKIKARYTLFLCSFGKKMQLNKNLRETNPMTNPKLIFPKSQR
ncbi:hypothetical protein HN51_040864 [Arachis hypogaea]